MELYTGQVTKAPTGSADGEIQEDEGGTTGAFVNGNIQGINVGDRFSFLKIIQETPQGDRVIRILKKRLPA